VLYTLEAPSTEMEAPERPTHHNSATFPTNSVNGIEFRLRLAGKHCFHPLRRLLTSSKYPDYEVPFMFQNQGYNFTGTESGMQAGLWRAEQDRVGPQVTEQPTDARAHNVEVMPTVVDCFHAHA